MTTAEYINWVMTRTGYQGTTEEIREYINLGQNKIFSYNTYLNRKKPIASCILPTEAGILQYVVPDPLVRQVARVYTIDGYGERQMVAVETEESLRPGADCTLYFREDPGTTTGQYYMEAYLWPQNGQITSSSVELSVPEKVQTEALFYAVSKMLEVDKDGRSIYNLEEEDRWFRDYFTSSNQGADLEPTIPDEGGF